MNRKQRRKPLEEMNVIDDFMMNALASHPTEGEKFGRTLLSVLLQKKIGSITIQPQSVFQGDTPDLRGVRLDVEILEKSEAEGESAVLSIYDVEMQNREQKDLPRRSRFYQAKIDSKNLESDEKDWAKKPRVYVIIITSYDPFGYDYMRYTVRNKCVELPEMEYEDGLRYIYFYTKGKRGGNQEIKALLNYLQQSVIENVTDENTQSIHESVERIKQSAEVKGKYMTIGEIMDYNKEIGREEGLAEGQAQGIILAMRALKCSEKAILQQLMELCQLTKEEALEYLKQE